MRGIRRYLKLSLFVVSLVLLCLFTDQGFFKLRRLKATEGRMRRENIDLAKKNTEMKEEVRRLKDSTYLEKMIRERLGYARPHEIIVEVSE